MDCQPCIARSFVEVGSNWILKPLDPQMAMVLALVLVQFLLWASGRGEDLQNSVSCSEAEDEGLEMRQLRVDRRHTTPFGDELDASARCCLCSSGLVTWSTDGCRACQDEVQKIASVSPLCKTDSPNFKGSSACQSECHTLLMEPGIFAQEEADEHDEVVADEGDDEVLEMPHEWGFGGTTENARAAARTRRSSEEGRLLMRRETPLVTCPSFTVQKQRCS
ncbi:unnamed protein product [Durusdinium trenchii]|uniref:Uncharacterized protein n=4 Tax=Durusdinium trenchii TaxID=1381693 RepID=A0ABP0SEI1_9DINO